MCNLEMLISSSLEKKKHVAVAAYSCPVLVQQFPPNWIEILEEKNQNHESLSNNFLQIE